MQCPRCGRLSSVIETRTGAHFTTRRRRECDNLHKFTTVEIHSAAYGSVRQRLVVLAATTRKRVSLWVRNQKIIRALAAGVPAVKLAADNGLGKSAISWIKRNAHAGK